MAVSLKRPGHVTITVYDLLGRRVDTLVDAELMPVGSTTILWDASGLVPGLYVYSLEVDAQRIQTRTALVLR
jgi:hypothetical protein